MGSSSHGTPSRRAYVAKPPDGRETGDGAIILSLDKSIVQNGSSRPGHKNVCVCVCDGGIIAAKGTIAEEKATPKTAAYVCLAF